MQRLAKFKSVIGLLAVVLLGMLPHPSQAQGSSTYLPCTDERNTDAEALDKKYELNGIRVFYTTTGSNALTQTADTNANNVPDYVEDIATQLDVSRRIFNSMGLRDPLESARFRVAKSIDVHLRDTNPYSVTSILFPIRYPYNSLMSDKCALVMLMSNTDVFDIVNGSTPAQRMFRFFLLGYTMFRPPWAFGDVANWAARSILTGTYGTGWDTSPLPASAVQMQDVFSSQNDAGVKFWNRLAYLAGSEVTGMPISADLAQRKYVSGAPVVKDNDWKGASIVRAVFQTLDAEDDVLDLQLGRPPYQWTDADQMSPANNARLLNLIQRVVRRTGLSSTEVNSFLAIPSSF